MFLNSALSFIISPAATSRKSWDANILKLKIDFNIVNSDFP